MISRTPTFSFRVFEYGIFGVLLLVDLLTRGRLFTTPDGEPLDQTTGTEEDLHLESNLREEPEPAY